MLLPPPPAAAAAALSGPMLAVAFAALWLRARRRAARTATALRDAEQVRGLLVESIEATPCNFAVFAPDGELLAWNSAYEALHRHAFATLPRPLRYADLMREAARGTLPPEQVEAEVANRLARHFGQQDSSFERLYPDGRWMSISKRRLRGGHVAGFATDITDLKQREAATAQSEARFRGLVDTASVSIWHLDRAGRTVFANGRLVAMFGGAMPMALEGSGLEAGSSDHPAHPFGFVPGQEADVVLRRPDGRELHLLVTASGWVAGADGAPGCVLTLIDVSPLKAAQARVEHLAQHDPLTGVGNRSRFAQVLDQALAAPDGCTLLLIDLDHFKAANDRHGHAVGDAILRTAANRMRAALRPGDVVCRLGGDEFAAVLPAWHEAGAQAIGARLVHELGQPYVVGDVTVGLSASIGIAGAAGGAMAAARLMHAADLALYHVKRGGRAACALFREEIEAAHAHQQVLQEELELAPLRGELALAFQPQVGTATGQVDCVEALLRWTSRRLDRTVPPGEFLPVAEAAGLMPAIDAWVLDAALRQAADWARDRTRWRGAPRRVAINVSAATLADPGFADRVAEALRRWAVPAAGLEIEVPENVAVANLGPVAATLRQLRAVGVRLALDDLGGGLSSFAHVVQLPVDRLKLDRSIVARLGDDGGGDVNGQAMLRAAFAVARGLDLEVVAEGVETEAQLAALRREGCTVVQGFLTGRPMPPEALRRALAPGAERAAEQEAPAAVP